VASPIFQRYVAIGDSSTEGLDDPDGLGGYRGWANRLAERIAGAQATPLLYANLAVRGLPTARIRAEQLGPALELRPDLVTLFAGTNDVVAWRFNADAVARDMEYMQRTLIQNGATVLGFTLPDFSKVLPLARPLSARVHALNDTLRAASKASGAILIDFAQHSIGTDPRIWSEDRLHVNAAGHARIAEALAWALGLPGRDEAWSRPLPPAPPRSWKQKLGAELAWSWQHFLPWIWRALNGRSSSHGRSAKRPQLLVVPPRPT
jgi:lysophospholipase L1-like esterase